MADEIQAEPVNPAITIENKKHTLPPAAAPYMWQPGQSGNPSGRPKKKPITELYERMMGNPETLAAIEQAIIKSVSESSPTMVSQLREIADRIEGRAIQAVEHSGPDGGPIQASVTVNFVKTGATPV
jgi:hypothetical protein